MFLLSISLGKTSSILHTAGVEAWVVVQTVRVLSGPAVVCKPTVRFYCFW